MGLFGVNQRFSSHGGSMRSNRGHAKAAQSAHTWKKAQSGPGGGSAAVLIVIIAAVLVLYVLFLPPDVREQLLNGDKASSGSGSGSGNSGNILSLVDERVGQLTSLSKTSMTHDLSSFRIYDTTQAVAIKELNSVYVKRSVFTTQAANFTFSLNPQTSNNVKLAFNVHTGEGILFVAVNGVQIAAVSASDQQVQPIPIPNEVLQQINTVTFEASSPGVFVWRVDEFLLEPVSVVADVTDVSALRAEQSFSLSSAEAQNLDTATLFFFPECDRSTVAPLEISLNFQRIYKGIADCGVKNNVDLNVQDLTEGKNTLTFQTASGSYLLDTVSVKTNLKKPLNPVYYFDLASTYFTRSVTQDRLCGQSDGYCPTGCDATQDPDCCYAQSTFWCTMGTTNVNDRCVDYATSTQCGRCPSGYQDSSQDVPDACKGTCGDDSDGVCPTGCSRLYDKDCCYADSKSNYWCNEVPVTGVEDKCSPNVGQGQCSSCPSGYVDGDGNSFSCPARDILNNAQEKLLVNYDVNMTVDFAGDGSKRVDILVNGHTISIDTTQREVSRIIDVDVQSGTNTIELVPRNDIQITKFSVTLKKRS